MQDAIITLSANESLCRLFVIASNEEASWSCSNAANLHKLLEQEDFQQLPFHTDTHGTPPGPMGGSKARLLGGPTQPQSSAQAGVTPKQSWGFSCWEWPGMALCHEQGEVRSHQLCFPQRLHMVQSWTWIWLQGIFQNHPECTTIFPQHSRICYPEEP